jgi:hypothetical protein
LLYSIQDLRWLVAGQPASVGWAPRSSLEITMDPNATLDQEYAEDVSDLREAQRLIARLRRALEQPSTLDYYADGEFTVFLDDLHSERLVELFEQRRLVAGQAAACELHDALSAFVSHWLDVQWKAQQLAHEHLHERSQSLTITA